jgi:NADH dehydrogenase
MRVVIVGAGFGGLRVARTLSGSGLDVLLLDRQDHHLFTPLLYQVATGALPPEAVAIPLADVVSRWPGVTFRQTDVSHIDRDARQVQTPAGPVPYDCLVLTAGAVRNYFGLSQVEQHAYDLKKLHQALALRERILAVCAEACHEPDPVRRAALRTVVIVGAGPTGVEFACALAEMGRVRLPRLFPLLRRERLRIVILEAQPILLAEFPRGLQRYAARRLKQLGIELFLATPVKDAGPEGVLLADGSTLPTRTLVWAAGVVAAPVAEDLPGGRTRAGRVPVEPDLTVPGHPEIFVLGDMCYLKQDDRALPMTAPVAVQQGKYVGRAILMRQRGQTPSPFRFRDMGAMAVLGHCCGVASFRGLTFTGFAGWLIWVVLHLAYLVGYRNPLGVLFSWARAYFFPRSNLGPGKPVSSGDP